MITTTEQEMAVTPADWVAGPQQGHWTYNHYATLPEDGQHYEIVAGVLYMTPSPNKSHQDAVLWFSHYLLLYVRIAGLGQVFVAPFDVELAPDVVVQPDIVVVLNAGLEKITPTRIIGPPDLVVEVSSPGTAGYDRHIKQDAYARAGIQEYWIADPAAQTVEVLLLEGGGYYSLGVFSGQMRLSSRVVPTITEVQVEQFFA
ncbi:MAG TPA: Uma2 family endonuclease [Ktedonobacteraceae bacterium]|nr:Uma2 family endonuclease [Ktedonobacteraceae bacterium]